jgi:prepilin-type N-terminal cleavage/methylation domain-containing protein
MVLMAQQRTNRTAQGFSLLEVMIAVSVLAVGLLGGMGVICVATASNGSSKLNTAAATLAESTMERIMAIPQDAVGADAMTSITDCRGNRFVMDTTAGQGSPLTTGLFPGIDYRQPPVANYSMLYSMCTAGPALAYDVRWRIDPGPTPSTQLITVSVKSVGAAGNPAAGLARKFTLHSLRGD